MSPHAKTARKLGNRTTLQVLEESDPRARCGYYAGTRRRPPRHGSSVLAVRNGFRGLRDGAIQEMDWIDVSGLVWIGGAELGTNCWVPAEADFAQIAEHSPGTGSTGC